MLALQKFYQLLSPIFDQPVQDAIMREVIWTEEEICNRMKDDEKDSGLPFWDVLVSRARSSIAGQFINEFNEGAPTDQQLRELQMDANREILMDSEYRDEYEALNNIVDNMDALIAKIIRTEGDKAIHFETFLGYLDMLRLIDSRIGSLDKNLFRLNNLQILVLSGNVIEELPFDNLPPSLRVLELNNNLISKIKIDHKIAPRLLYLGLSANCFSDESIMKGLPFLDKLCLLDLSDNNFTSFGKVAEVIRCCPYLECICLKGNPLSTAASYKEIIKALAPKLHQLDGMPLSYEAERAMFSGLQRKRESKERHRKVSAKKEKHRRLPLRYLHGFCYTAELRIYVFRTMGVPKPQSKNQKGKGYFQFEVQLPLLDQRHKVHKKCSAMFELLRQCQLIPEASEFPQVEESKSEIDHKTYDSKSTKTELHSRSRFVKKKESWEIEYEEFLANDQQMPGAYRILSEKMKWSPVMKPNGPIAVVPVNSANLSQLRYTLKSIIVIRLFFNSEDPQDEKKLIAKISIPAQEPHWWEEYCSYEWNAKHPQIATVQTIGNAKTPIGSREIQNHNRVICSHLPLGNCSSKDRINCLYETNNRMVLCCGKLAEEKIRKTPFITFFIFGRSCSQSGEVNERLLKKCEHIPKK